MIISKLCPRDDLHEALAVAEGGGPEQTPPPSPTGDPAIQEWMDKVNASGGRYGAADAAWACDQLNKAGDQAAWDAVGDDRLIWAGRLLCTQHEAAVERAVNGFRDGEYVVGTDESEVAPGSYVSRPKTTDCYWERVSSSGDTIANDFVSFAPQGARLLVKSSDAGIKVQGCGPWVTS